MKTPGVYIVEKDAFPNSVVEVPTAVPAFIGYTARHAHGERDLRLLPRRITSLAEYETYFGAGPDPGGAYDLTTTPNEALGPDRVVSRPKGPLSPVARAGDDAWYLARIDGKPRRLMYHGLASFFMNGGGPCYIVSLGTYSDPLAPDEYTRGLEALENEREPTILVLPDAPLMPAVDAATVYNQAIAHCTKVQSRVVILDVFRGFNPRSGPDIAEDCVATFREDIVADELRNAVCYYPWVETTVTLPTDPALTYRALSTAGRTALAAIVRAELEVDERPDSAARAGLQSLLDGITDDARATGEVHEGLRSNSDTYRDLLAAIAADINLLPPSSIMAGVFTRVDEAHGVWKAPANVGLVGVIRPAVHLTHEEQEGLNVHATGKSVNAIRAFVGEGTMVWGARTMDSNSLDRRYVNVRRTLIMLEQSISLASRAFVFETNDANTWTTMKSMIRNFLASFWKRGGLAGASADEAFSVRIGLGETMTAEDILEGILRVSVLVAPTRPAEFVEITFQQQMQKS